MTNPSAQTLHSPQPTATWELEQKLTRLREGASAFARLPISNRLHLLEHGLEGVRRVAERWVRLACTAKGLDFDSPASAEEWLGGPMTTLRNLRLLREALLEIRDFGLPQLPDGAISTREDGTVVARVFPKDLFDRALYNGFTADVWMQEGITPDNVHASMAEVYQSEETEPAVTLVLGAGNVASIGPMDAMHELFIKNSVCILKLNPVNAYRGPVLEDAFAGWIEPGFLEICYGGAEVGEFLCQHASVDRIHITGSDRTHDAIVWGPSHEWEERKATGTRYNDKPVTSELGNVSPVIIVPGDWSDGDLRFQAENVATMLVNNGSFNCNAAKLLVMHKEWKQRGAFIAALKRVLNEIPTRAAYYPGAAERYDALVKGRDSVERIGQVEPGALPWTLVLDVDATEPSDAVFRTEPFCAVLSETSLSASSTAEFLRAATSFCNDVVWGTLNACLIVHPGTLGDAETADAFEEAIANLRYGTVAINHWPALGYGLTVTPWGAYPGHSMEDIQSGQGVVHNTYMFSKPQKAVIRGPFRVFPKPPWFVTHKRAHAVARQLTSFEYQPAAMKLPGIVFHALRG